MKRIEETGQTWRVVGKQDKDGGTTGEGSQKDLRRDYSET